MFFVVAGWAWTLRYSLVAPPTAAGNATPLDEVRRSSGQTADDFTALFEEVGRTLDRFQAAAPAAPPSQSGAHALTPQAIELLKRKLEEQAGQSPSP
jgi:hypothetical protein